MRNRGEYGTPAPRMLSSPPSPRSSTTTRWIDFEAGVAEHLGRSQRVAARGDDVLDHRDSLAALESSLDLL